MIALSSAHQDFHLGKGLSRLEGSLGKGMARTAEAPRSGSVLPAVCWALASFHKEGQVEALESRVGCGVKGHYPSLC